MTGVVTTTTSPKEVGPDVYHHAEAVPATPETKPETTEEIMLLRKETLTPAAKKHFKLPRNPFVDDVQCREDVFASRDGRYIRAVLLEAALKHGFVAIMGESGSGKSTLREDFEERVRVEKRPIIVIKPYAREPHKTGAKSLRSSQIESAIFRALAPGVRRKSDPDDRTHQLHELLKASRSAGYCHLLVLEEAHRLPVDTLKQLKNTMELKDGMKLLIGVVLIGQTRELEVMLNDRDPDVREIVQRCEHVHIEPLGDDLQGYLEHKFARIGVKLSDVMAPDAISAMHARLTSEDGESVCYPLVVNNLTCRALNAAANTSWPVVDAQVIAGC